jgi:hypothetical protein
MASVSPEARYAVYLVDPGPDLPAVTALLQEVLGVGPEAAASCLRDLPGLVTFCEEEAGARRLAARFRECDAVAVVRPADQPLAPAPVEEVAVFPAQRALHALLAVLGVVQIGLALLWLAQGRAVAAFFGLLLGLYVLVYFGRQLTGSAR